MLLHKSYFVTNQICDAFCMHIWSFSFGSIQQCSSVEKPTLNLQYVLLIRDLLVLQFVLNSERHFFLQEILLYKFHACNLNTDVNVES